MRMLSSRVVHLALVLGAPLVVILAVAACSGGGENGSIEKATNNSTGGNGTNGGNNGGSGANNNTTSNQAGSCSNPTIDLEFSPMFSAYVEGSTTHQFQIPATANSTAALTWSASDPSKVSLTPDPTSGGIMITIKASGDLTIIATAKDGSCGAAPLSVTSATEADWQIGNARYNNGNSLKFGKHDGGGGGGGGGLQTTDGGGPACTNCHGPTATNGPFKDVSHTPEQTGGFSDQDLFDLIVNGVVPDGGYFDPNVIIADASGSPELSAKAYQRWQGFHAWKDIDDDQKLGMVVYLRSLAPAPQEGTSNFGGHRDGGHHDSGF